MSTVWGTKHRLLVERCTGLVDCLAAPELTEPALLEEELVRLLLVVVRLLQQHDLNEQGRCRYCRWPHRAWRFRRRPRCSIFQALDLAMGEELAVVWWQLFTASGRDVGLNQVRAWVATTTEPLRHDASTCPADAD